MLFFLRFGGFRWVGVCIMGFFLGGVFFYLGFCRVGVRDKEGYGIRGEWRERIEK